MEMIRICKKCSKVKYGKRCDICGHCESEKMFKCNPVLCGNEYLTCPARTNMDSLVKNLQRR